MVGAIRCSSRPTSWDQCDLADHITYSPENSVADFAVAEKYATPDSMIQGSIMKSHDLMRIRAGAVIGVALLASARLSGQDPISRPAFEVASVRPAGPNENPMGRGIFTFPGGRIIANKCTLAKAH